MIKKKMKILLVNPPNCGRSIPEEEYGITSIRQIFRGEPFSLEVLAAPLIDHEVVIIDLKCESEEVLLSTLEDFRPDIVGFTSLTCEANTVIRLAAKIKEQANPVIVIGGNHATYVPEYFNRKGIDYVVTGLGKKSFSELVEALACMKNGEGIPGISRTSPGKPLNYIPRNFDSDDLMGHASPRYDLVDKYRDHYILEKMGLKMGFVITAYGCTHKCSFCTIPHTTGGKYLTHSADSVIRDMQLLGDIPFIRMVDANTFGNPSLSLKLCEKIGEAGIKKKIFADVRADTIVSQQSLLRKWKDAGLYAAVVGFEDIEDSRLAVYNKKYQGRIIDEAIEILHDIGIVIVGDFIISPDYEEKEFIKLERFIDTHKIELPVLSVLTPMPGTKLYEDMKDQIIIDDLDYYTFTNAVTKTKMPPELFYAVYADLIKRLHNSLQKPD
ncbi:MAG: radical SAM protein [Smithella sp.]